MNESVSIEVILGAIDAIAPKTKREEAISFQHLRKIIERTLAAIERVNINHTTEKLASENVQLRASREKLTKEIDYYQKEYNEYIILQQEEKELTVKKNIIEDIEQKQRGIEELKKFVDDHSHLNGLELDRDIKKYLNENTEEVLNTVSVAEKLSIPLKDKVLEKLDVIVNQLQNNQKVITDRYFSTIERLIAKNKSNSTSTEMEQKSLNQLIEKHNGLVAKLTKIKADINEISLKYENNNVLFQLHLSENKKIWTALESHEDLVLHVDELMTKIESDLKVFDNNIKQLVDQSDKLKKTQQ